MDTMTVPPDIFGTPEQKFTPTKHLGSDASRLSQLQDGKWKVVSDYFSTGALAQNSNQGVSKTEITLGSIQDLSGPIAGFGKQVRLGMMLRVDEVNEQGGIHGRKIVLKVEDSAYDPKKAVLAAQKLVNQDKIFAMVGHIGTAQNLATFPVLFEKNIINFFPVTAAREMYEPFNRLKYSFAATYFDQMRLAAPKLVKEKSAKKVCAMYQDDEFGKNSMRVVATREPRRSTSARSSKWLPMPGRR
jgi:branched-chain amino acid transport system substrate-binding protein